MTKLSIQPFQFFALYSVFATALIGAVGSTMDDFQNVYLTGLLGLFIGIVFIIVNYYAFFKLTERDGYENIHLIFGTFFGKIFTFLYIGYFILAASIVIRSFSLFISVSILPNTDYQSIKAVFLLPALVAILLGAQSIVRSSVLFFIMYFGFIIIAIIMLFFSNAIHLEYLFPMLQISPKDVFNWETIADVCSPYTGISAFMCLYVFVPNLSLKTPLFAGILGGLTVILLAMLDVVVLHPYFAKSVTYPTLITMTKIQLGVLFRRIDIIAFAWIMLSTMIKLIIYMFAISELIRKLLKHSKPIASAFISTFIVLLVSLPTEANQIQLIEFARTTSFYGIQLPFVFIIPCLMIVLFWIRKKLGYIKIN
ncbi:MAG: GerAB/ArcD/ProY family transporter [Bacilli bacterium]